MREYHAQGCMLCGKQIVYYPQSSVRECCLCHKTFQANSACIDGHYVCDSCHMLTGLSYLDYFERCEETRPHVLFEDAIRLPNVHMHGPEHHFLIPCILITCYANLTGNPNKRAFLQEALKRGMSVPGGACGFRGCCGNAEGAGIFLSIILGSSPLNKKVWHLPQLLVAQCLIDLCEIGGPRCCKRTGKIVLYRTIEFLKENLGVEMENEPVLCSDFRRNCECLHKACPFFPSEH